jgi:hypothetical protein
MRVLSLLLILLFTSPAVAQDVDLVLIATEN